MNPDAYMPFYGDDFFNAVRGQEANVSNAYLKAIWYYWSHEHCRGLKDEEEFLRRVCECDKEEWPDVLEIVFDNDRFFTLGEDGKWHQKRAALEWQKAKDAYDKQVARTAAATAARLAKLRNRR